MSVWFAVLLIIYGIVAIHLKIPSQLELVLAQWFPMLVLYFLLLPFLLLAGQG